MKDSTIGNGYQAAYCFDSAGTYTVTFEVCSQAFSKNILVYPLPGDFTYAVTDSTTVDFMMDATTTPAGFLWNFGDGTQDSTAPNPTHQYDSVGAYNVVLQVTDDKGCSNMLFQQVNLFPDSLSSNQLAHHHPESLNIIPNPSEGRVWVRSSQDQIPTYSYYLRLYNMQGYLVFEQPWLTGNSQSLDLWHLSKGIYLLSVTTPADASASPQYLKLILY